MSGPDGKVIATYIRATFDNAPRTVPAAIRRQDCRGERN
jgi:hypothetical protein